MSNARTVKIRMAENEDAEEIARIALENGFVVDGLEVDWSEVWPYWLIAKQGERTVGAVQTCPSKPVGRIELLFTASGLSKRELAVIVKGLIDAGETLLRQQGSQLSAGTISWKQPSFCAVAENRGWMAVDSGTVMMRRLV